MSKKSGLSGPFLFITVWSLVTLTCDGLLVVNSYRQIRATSYEQAVGQVTHCEMTVHKGRKGASYGLDVRYSYRVDDIELEGERYRYQWISLGNSSSFRKIVNSFSVGKAVDVYYNPSDPTDCVLIVGVEGRDLLLPLFSAPWNAMMLGGWFFGLRCLIQSSDERKPGGARITQRGFQVRVHLKPVPPIGSALLPAGATAFGLAFVVALGFGLNPPMIVAQVVWYIVLGVAGIAFVWACRPSAVNASRLLIDEVSGILTLPCTCGRRTPIEVSANSIERIEVAESAADDDASDESDLPPGTVCVRIVLSRTGGDDPERREPLAEYQNKQAAERLAQWLTEELASVGRR